jgi:beta-lactamase class A
MFESMFEEAGCSGSIHAVHLATRSEVGHEPDRPQVSASVVKVPIALEFYAQADSGALDPTRAVVIDSTNRTSGPTGVARFQDPASISLRDLALLMLTISDNAATQVIEGAVGLESVNRRLGAIGCHDTVVCGFGGILDGVADDLGFVDYSQLLAAQSGELGPEAHARSIDRPRIDASRALDATRTSHTTARDATRLLAAIWEDSAASPSACATLRSVMGQQLTRRLAPAVPEGGGLAAKSGALFGRVTNEIAVITDPDGDAYAVAVFTRAHVPFRNQAAINAAMANAASHAISVLGSPSETAR